MISVVQLTLETHMQASPVPNDGSGLNLDRVFRVLGSMEDVPEPEEPTPDFPESEEAIHYFSNI
jgi:hypothetical protein